MEARHRKRGAHWLKSRLISNIRSHTLANCYMSWQPRRLPRLSRRATGLFPVQAPCVQNLRVHKGERGVAIRAAPASERGGRAGAHKQTHAPMVYGTVLLFLLVAAPPVQHNAPALLHLISSVPEHLVNIPALLCIAPGEPTHRSNSGTPRQHTNLARRYSLCCQKGF